MPTRGNMTIEDYSGETTTTSCYLNDIQVGGPTFDSVTQDMDEIKDAIIPVIRGVVRKTAVTKEYPEDLFNDVTDIEAQREQKWLAVMRDTTQFLDLANLVACTGYGKHYTIEIGTALLTGNLLDGEDKADLVGSTDMAALVTSLEANTRSPWNHSPEIGVTPTQAVVEIRHVGRNT